MTWKPLRRGAQALTLSRGRGKSIGWRFKLSVFTIGLLSAIFLWKPWKKAGTTAILARPPQTEAQKLTQQARALIDDDPLAVRENFRLAEDLCQRAVQADPPRFRQP